LVLDKIRRRFPWLELIWADGGYNARQVETAIAKVPLLRMEIVKRNDEVKGLRRFAAPTQAARESVGRRAAVVGSLKGRSPAFHGNGYDAPEAAVSKAEKLRRSVDVDYKNGYFC
jgi:hypothetical protein